jgi:sulfatase maturation enzyme AslB (radical SAM superfamily)
MLGSNPKIISVYLDLNGACNLRCSYCTEDKTPPKNSDYLKIISDIFNNIDFIYGYTLTTVYSSSEPFYDIELLTKISNYFYLKCLVDNSQFRLLCSTNGTLLGNTDVKQFLLNYKKYIKLYLSLDGWENVQDINRPNSWKKIIENWKFFQITCNVCFFVIARANCYSILLQYKELVKCYVLMSTSHY